MIHTPSQVTELTERDWKLDKGGGTGGGGVYPQPTPPPEK